MKDFDVRIDKFGSCQLVLKVNDEEYIKETPLWAKLEIQELIESNQ